MIVSAQLVVPPLDEFATALISVRIGARAAASPTPQSAAQERASSALAVPLTLDPTSHSHNCTLGIGGVVHDGVTMGEGAVLAADSFLMKGEEVPADAHWGGNPAYEQPLGERVV
jgi:acetyltransferase-like isoleucine patch superfamily enzyme